MSIYTKADLRTRITMVAFLIASVVAAQDALSLRFPIKDPFHNGEFLAAAMAVLHQAPFEGDPFTIHGAVDIFPALVVSVVVPASEFLTSYTLVLYPLLSLLAIVLTMFAALRIVRRLGGDPLLMIPFLVLVPYAVGWRDLFFALSLFLFAGLFRLPGPRSGTVAAQIMFGFVIALGTYWSFNRGVAALLAFGPVTLWLAWRDRHFLISVGTALASFVALGATVPGISVFGYVENFLVLLETSSQWRYSPSTSGKVWTAALLAAFATATVAALSALRARGADRQRIALTAALLVAGAVYTKIALGRIDAPHLLMGVWLPLLTVSVSVHWGSVPLPRRWGLRATLAVAVILMAKVLSSPDMYDKIHHTILLITFLIPLGALLFPQARFVAGVTIAVLIVAFAGSAPLLGMYKFKRGDFDWLLSLNDLPANDRAVTGEILWTGRSIKQSGANCVFDLANTGLVNAVAGLPSCSRFTYPVYANNKFEDRLISDLRAAYPPVIVYRSDYWSYAIDGRPMDERFPALDAEIKRLYPYETCNHGVCLRYME